MTLALGALDEREPAATGMVQKTTVKVAGSSPALGIFLPLIIYTKYIIIKCMGNIKAAMILLITSIIILIIGIFLTLSVLFISVGIPLIIIGIIFLILSILLFISGTADIIIKILKSPLNLFKEKENKKIIDLKEKDGVYEAK